MLVTASASVSHGANTEAILRSTSETPAVTRNGNTGFCQEFPKEKDDCNHRIRSLEEFNFQGRNLRLSFNTFNGDKLAIDECKIGVAIIAIERGCNLNQLLVILFPNKFYKASDHTNPLDLNQSIHSMAESADADGNIKLTLTEVFPITLSPDLQLRNYYRKTDEANKELVKAILVNPAMHDTTCVITPADFTINFQLDSLKFASIIIINTEVTLPPELFHLHTQIVYVDSVSEDCDTGEVSNSGKSPITMISIREKDPLDEVKKFCLTKYYYITIVQWRSEHTPSVFLY